MAAFTICSDFGAPKNKVWHCFHCWFLPYIDMDQPQGYSSVFLICSHARVAPQNSYILCLQCFLLHWFFPFILWIFSVSLLSTFPKSPEWFSSGSKTPFSSRVLSPHITSERVVCLSFFLTPSFLLSSLQSCFFSPPFYETCSYLNQLIS